MGAQKISSHAGLTHTIAQVSSGNTGGTVGLTSQPNRHAIGSDRFLLDAPESELGDPISLCFLTELAYWFYLDEYAEEDDSLNNIKFDPFAQQLLNRVRIKPNSGTIEEMLQDFRDFKHRVPTYGGLLLNQDLTQVLLVQVSGHWRGHGSTGCPIML
ncbi:m7GpppN-mRNA hydrolase [Portunus trituberculatus]|uniref:M7GpppN-mRNA hydrolase n=1 Tax=Portunus trituberculatus TaxID=210409 RepID=A0A5B7GDD5_PORTR|nr:m7GpppN-mRNA hydrolase [Portunus trituberculatus]